MINSNINTNTPIVTDVSDGSKWRIPDMNLNQRHFAQIESNSLRISKKNKWRNLFISHHINVSTIPNSILEKLKNDYLELFL